ncbi:hypothetical protein AVEN_239908-1 [Araneus ventricosus]|uniref:SWIM-type domain-containing protein n=1 Tax=Araneus ventricosus TaxID=182803 RepID=A0A4Y2S8D7_ARAVE|nr:hypothetical protein AVEN_239908-1 [Araneus ventricosus]
MNAVAKKLLSRIISMERGKLTHRVALIRKRHTTSNEMKENYSFVKMDENTYVVTKKVGPSLFTYNVEKTNFTCCCSIKCNQYSVCIHSMSCTCIDYSVKFIICKHIHYVCLNSEKLNECKQNSENANEDNNLIIDIDEKKEKQSREKEAIIPSLQKHNEDLDMRKSRIRQQLKELDSMIQGWDKLYPLPDVEDRLKGIKASLEIAIPSTSACKQSELPNVPKAPSNKQITKQRKFQIKKKGLRKEKLKQ